MSVFLMGVAGLLVGFATPAVWNEGGWRWVLAMFAIFSAYAAGLTT